MKFVIKGNKGFSLVELMIVVGIIGILASLAIPRLTVFMAKAKQAEVKTNLSALTTLQRTFYNENNSSTYGANITEVSYATPSGARYAYDTNKGQYPSKNNDAKQSNRFKSNTWHYQFHEILHNLD